MMTGCSASKIGAVQTGCNYGVQVKSNVFGKWGRLLGVGTTHIYNNFLKLEPSSSPTSPVNHPHYIKMVT